MDSSSFIFNGVRFDAVPVISFDDSAKFFYSLDNNTFSIENLTLDKSWMAAQASKYNPIKEEVLAALYAKDIASQKDIISKNIGSDATVVLEQYGLYFESLCKFIGVNSGEYVLTATTAELSDLPQNTLILYNKTTQDCIVFTIQATINNGKIVLTNGELLHYFLLLKAMQKESSALGDNDVDNLLAGLLGVLSTLSFALPPPWGVLTAAGFQLIASLIGNLANGGQFSTIVQTLDKLLQDEFASHDIKTYAANLSSYMNQYNLFLSTLNVNPDNVEYIKTEVIPFLMAQKQNISSSSIYNNFNQILVKEYYKPKDVNDKLGQYSLVLLSQLVTAILLNQKSLIVLNAQLASLDKANFSKYSDNWLGEYEEFRLLILGDDASREHSVKSTVDYIYNYLTKYRMDSLSMNRHCIQTGMGGCYVDLQDKWMDTDVSESYHSDTSESYDSWVSRWDANFEKAKSEANNEIVSYTNHYFPGNEISEKLQIIVDSWDANIVPKKVVNTLVIQFNTDSSNPIWQNQEKISYSISFVNHIGEVKLAPSVEVEIVVGKSATLINIPTDPLFLTRRRIIYRIINGQSQIAGVLKDNITTTFEDN